MVADGYLNCIMYGVKGFNPEKTNPFAYFTQIITYAFWRRIKKEKKELYGKFKIIQNSNVMNLTSSNDGKNYVDEITYGFGAEQYMNEFIQEYEDTEDAKKKRTTSKTGIVPTNTRKSDRTSPKVE